MTNRTSTEVVENVSATFDLLQNARRRGVLYVVERNHEIGVGELAHRIADWQSDDRDATDPRTVELSLVHSHLPKLADAGVVEYDRERSTVTLTESASDLEPFLEHSREREPGQSCAAQPSQSGRRSEAEQ